MTSEYYNIAFKYFSIIHLTSPIVYIYFGKNMYFLLRSFGQYILTDVLQSQMNAAYSVLLEQYRFYLYTSWQIFQLLYMYHNSYTLLTCSLSVSSIANQQYLSHIFLVYGVEFLLIDSVCTEMIQKGAFPEVYFQVMLRCF